MGCDFVEFTGDLEAEVVEVKIVFVVLKRVFAGRKEGCELVGKCQIRLYTYISAPISRKPSKRNAAKVVILQITSATEMRGNKREKAYGIVNHLYAVYIWNGNVKI